MNARTHLLTQAADKWRSFVLYSAEDGGRVPRIEKAGIIELGICSIRNFFEHPMATYAAALAYRGLFGLFPFLLLLVVFVGALEFPDFFDRGRDQIQPLVRMIEQAQKRANGELPFFGVALALWSVSAVAHPHRGLQRCLRGRRDASAVVGALALFGLWSSPRAHSDRLRRADADRAAGGEAGSAAGGLG